MGNQKAWVDSLWLTHKESITVGDVMDGEVVREINVGIMLKNDQSVLAFDLYKAARKALNRIVEEEKELWARKGTSTVVVAISELDEETDQDEPEVQHDQPDVIDEPSSPLTEEVNDESIRADAEGEQSF